VLVNGVAERHLEGSYYLDWHENGNRIRLAVGKNAGQALAQPIVQESRLAAKVNQWHAHDHTGSYWNCDYPLDEEFDETLAKIAKRQRACQK
jgi:hypothetical protein